MTTKKGFWYASPKFFSLQLKKNVTEKGVLVTKKLDQVGLVDNRPTTSTTMYKTNMTPDT